jgi:hypothetical protein
VPARVLEKTLRAFAPGHARARDSRDLAREPAGAAPDVEDLEPRGDPSRLDEQGDPEAKVVLREAGVEMLGRKPLGTKLDRVDAQ